MFNIVKLIQAALMCSIFTMAAGQGIMEEKAHRALQEKSDKIRAKNADEGLYQTYVSNKDANIQFEKGFFPYDPGEAYTGHYWQGKIFCFVLMFLAEIGDKTFIIVMVSYLELGACITFFTGYITLCAMHILASTLGWGISFVVPAFWTKLVATILFIVIAIAMFAMAIKDKHPDTVDTALGKKGHAVTVVVKPVKENVVDDTQKEGGDTDKSDSEHEEGSDKDSDEESHHEKSKKSSSDDESAHEEKDDSDESDSDEEDSAEESSGSEEFETTAKHLPVATVREPTTIVIAPGVARKYNQA
jgi:hypothetical protein